MSGESLLSVHNGQLFETAAVPVFPIDEFRRQVLGAIARGGRLAALFADAGQVSNPPREGATAQNAGSDAAGSKPAPRLVAVVARRDRGDLAVAAAQVEGEYPSLTPDCPQAHWFEREIAEQWGVRPAGHPWLKPIRRGAADFFRMEGDEVHEVAVGPVHAGIIEPGHFRFQCHGETVYHLEISLGYQHRGVERAMIGGPGPRTIHYAETLAGDTTVGHAHAYCRAIEALSKTRVPARAQVLRGVASELERIANHVGDLGALAGDVGFLPTQAYCGRIRGDVLNLTAVLCGNRFGRGFLRPGGVAFDLEAASISGILDRLKSIDGDLHSAVELLWNTPSVTARFDQAGTLSAEFCRAIGLVGVAARACGAEDDVRVDFPYAIYRFAHIPVSTWHTGDVFARAYVRWLEVQRSLAFVREQVQSLPEGPVLAPAGPLAERSGVVAMTEGWRGEICHVAKTDERGRLAAYKIVDPSFHNWFGLACALRGQQISDFPLCNKSFNLSYCGHDL